MESSIEKQKHIDWLFKLLETIISKSKLALGWIGAILEALRAPYRTVTAQALAAFFTHSPYPSWHHSMCFCFLIDDFSIASGNLKYTPIQLFLIQTGDLISWYICNDETQTNRISLRTKTIPNMKHHKKHTKICDKSISLSPLD